MIAKCGKCQRECLWSEERKMYVCPNWCNVPTSYTLVKVRNHLFEVLHQVNRALEELDVVITEMRTR